MADDEQDDLPPEELGTAESVLDELNESLAHRDVGAALGIETHELKSLPSQMAPVPIDCIDFSPERVEFTTITDIEDFIIQHRPDWVTVRWVNIDAITNMDVIRAFAEKYDLHPLSIEDLVHVGQRPKVETYPGHGEIHGRIFLVARMLQWIEETPGRGRLEGEQVSMYLGHNTVLTFQERPGSDVFDPIRNRLKVRNSRLRNSDASFLAYSLLDAIVDQCFPILEHYSDRLEELEDEVLTNPTPATIQQIHALKRELLVLRRAVWPTREVISALMREPHECLSDTTRTYFRDAYDHAVQIIDMVETYREFAASLTEAYMSALSNRMNEIMKVLTLITTIFVPLTFLAGVYGMNFKYFSELDQPWAYPVFWVVCLGTTLAMVLWFRRRRWL